MDTARLQTLYDDLKVRATEQAGDLLDIPRRAALLNGMYLDSGENLTFGQIAAHGALWAWGFFEVGGRLGKLVSYRYCFSSRERAYRLGLLNHFAENFRRVNRQVCIDTWTNYHFTKEYGCEPGAEQIVRPSLLNALNLVHAASKSGKSLSEQQKRDVFEQSFHWEQELTVAPGVLQAVSEFECPVMVALCTKPLVRFAYFPRMKYLWFRNFADKAERIDRGMQAYELARRAGWKHVADSMRRYGVMPAEFFAEPRDFAQRIMRGKSVVVAA